MGSVLFDFLTESFLFSNDLIAEQFASTGERELERELDRYREFCIAHEAELFSEAGLNTSTLKAFAGVSPVSIDHIKQAALYLEQYVIDDPLMRFTAKRSEFSKAMNKVLGMQERSVDKSDLANKISFLKKMTPMISAGFVKLLPVSALFEPPKEIPIFHSDTYFENVLPAELLKIFRDRAVVKSLRQVEKGWRIEEELFPCRMIDIEFRGYEDGKGYFYTYHDFQPEIVSEEDRIIRFPITMSDRPLSPELFAVWVRQSVNRAAQELYSQTFIELMLAGRIGAMYCTKSDLLAEVISMQLEVGDSIRAGTTRALMNMELPFLANVEPEKLMRVRTEEGDAFQNFRTELDKQLRDLRSIDDPEEASRKAKEVVHELTEVQIRDINNKLASLKEKLWLRAAVGTMGLMTAVYTHGASLLASASAALEPVLEYRKEIKRHPAFFLWKVLKK